ncbi:MAG: hypothetical protein WC824_11515 [Bacteroidota bacterium]|jgi:hypothetical protein
MSNELMELTLDNGKTMFLDPRCVKYIREMELPNKNDGTGSVIQTYDGASFISQNEPRTLMYRYAEALSRMHSVIGDYGMVIPGGK